MSVSFFFPDVKYIFKFSMKMFCIRLQYDSVLAVTKQTNANSVFALWRLACYVKTMFPCKDLWKVVWTVDSGILRKYLD